MGNPVDQGQEAGQGEGSGQWAVGTEPHYCRVLDCTNSGLRVDSFTSRTGVQARSHAGLGTGGATLQTGLEYGLQQARL